MKTTMAILIALVCSASAWAGDTTSSISEPMRLWPQGAPGEKGDIGAEVDTTKPDGDLIAGRRVIRLGNVTQPTITLYRPAKEKDTGASVIVCPGGGYYILAMDLEGTEICEWLNSIGVTGILLKYRVPARTDMERYAAPLQDAQRAMGMVRLRAKEWGLDPNRIGMLGFSAGGHLSAAASTMFDTRTYPAVDAADRESCRPDFVFLIYPGYLVRENDHVGPELTITSKTPPTFLVQTEDDGVRVENSVYYYMALKKSKVPAEMHIYSDGGHGYGLRPAGKLVTSWPKRAEEWMQSRGLLRK